MRATLARIGIVAAVVAVTMAHAAPASANHTEVTQVTTTAPAMHPGETAWVSVVWTAPETVLEFAVEAIAPPGFEVAYPAGRVDTSLDGSSSLAGSTQDFTAFRLTVPYSASGSAVVTLDASWRNGNNGNGVGLGSKGSSTTTITIPLVPYTGPDLTQVTTSVTVPRSTTTWVKLAFTAEAPRLQDFRLTASGPVGLTIGYPADGTSSGLGAGADLQGGDTDATWVRLDASQLAPGTYTLAFTASYRRLLPGTTTGKVTLVVS